MVEPSPTPDSTRDTPRWVKVFWITALVVVVLFVILLLAGGGGHGPGRHTGDRGDHAPPRVGTQGVQRP